MTWQLGGLFLLLMKCWYGLFWCDVLKNLVCMF